MWAIVRAALADRFRPYRAASGKAAAVDAAILAVQGFTNPTGHHGIVVHLSSDRNAIAAEQALAAAGGQVRRDEEYDPFAPGNTGVRLVIETGRRLASEDQMEQPL